MPRPRKFNPKIPAHIDQKALPRGVYWDATGNGRWYVLEHPRKAVTVAGHKALLSDLHAIAEARAGSAAKGTVGYVMARFEESTTFTGLAAGTQKGYRHQRKLVESYRTNLGVTLDQLAVARLGPAAIQRVVESIARGRDGEPPMPTKANHLLRYVRRMFAWGVQHGHCLTNPASGVAQAKERGKIKMPSPSSYARLTAFARERGQLDAHTAGSVAPYLAHLMVIAYSCRLRGIEVVTLTEANASEEGILSNRRKGSRDNITRWSPALREAWEALIQLRKTAEQRHRRPPQLHASKRPMLVSQRGTALSKSGLDSAWQRLISLAREGDDPVLAEDEVFTLHGLKHRGITDSKDKASGGHRTERMRQRYDHETPLVEPAELPFFPTREQKER